MNIPKSTIEDIIWPGIPARSSAVLMGIQFQLGQTEWWTEEKLKQLQYQQLDLLLQHAKQTVPYYKTTLVTPELSNGAPLSTRSWSHIPLLKREILQDRRNELLSQAVPKSHGQTIDRKTSGSSGRKIVITDTQVHQIYYMANTLRDHLWHQRDVSKTFVSIRSGRSSDDPLKVEESKGWGISEDLIYDTGQGAVFYQLMPVEQQAKELLKRNPAYILAYPSNVTRLAEFFCEHDLQLPGLQQISTYGENVLPETRDTCQKAWGVGVTDMYSCEETAYIALQCPRSNNYHCQSETILVEVLDEDGHACKTGEIGRVVLTVLHNFAMPLIRYENLDYAEVGPPCECGRGLPVIKRIMGRKRNMARALDGSRFWPELDPAIWSDHIYCDSLQFVQDESDHIELRIVAEQPLDSALEHDLTKSLAQALGQPYRFTVKYQQDSLRHANGKYERFICQV